MAGPETMVIEPNVASLGTPIDPVTTTILIDGQRVDPSGKVMVQAPKNSPHHVTPKITGCDWYQFEMFASSPHTVRMSWSKHPSAAAADVQAAFDAGARILAKDDDGPVLPGAPGFDVDRDDVNTYLEFITIKSKQATFPSDFAGENYRMVTSTSRLWELRTATWANIKLVDLIWLSGSPYETCGVAGPGASLVFESSRLCGFLAAHEYGHLTPLPHRGEGNPGPDPLAIMQQGGDEGGTPWPPSAVEVNRYERYIYESYDPGPAWND
jgi:hypothetical protein